MPLTLTDGRVTRWEVRKIAVVGPGIVGMPMAALLADARIREGRDTPARVMVVQRDSATSGWKVAAINQGRSPIGGVEPGLDEIVRRSAERGLLGASHDYAALADADVILIAVQTDRNGKGPDYGPLCEALNGIATALRSRPPGNVPLIVFESTLAPSSMATVIRDHFARFGLEEGRDILLGNSPNRVMPGRLVERVAASDKIVAGLHPETPRLIARLYARVVTRGRLHPTNSLTAEVVKTLENAYRDVRIAYATEVARYCDDQGIDFFALRDRINQRLHQTDAASRDSQAVPTGGLLVPTLGVGGHCLPKDGILLWWRCLEAELDTSGSLILEARQINDASPLETLIRADRAFGSLRGATFALLGSAYRGNSEDTRNSPALALAGLLRDRKISFRLHDPYVQPGDQNLRKWGLEERFTRDLALALADADCVMLTAPHEVYRRDWPRIQREATRLRFVYDASNLLCREMVSGAVSYAGIGRGKAPPPDGLVHAVFHGFHAIERGIANEVLGLITALNERYANDPFNTIRFEEVQRMAGTCPTGCAIIEPGPVMVPAHAAFRSRLVARAIGQGAEDVPG